MNMFYYEKYFHKEIRILAFTILTISLLGIIIDLIFNYKIYPIWVNQISLITLFICVLLIFFSISNSLKVVDAFIIFAYVYTFNIYLPGFLGDYSIQQNTISTFSNLGSCLVFIFLVGSCGAKLHIFLLGGFNIAFILLLTLLGQPDISLDITNIFIFIASILVSYFTLVFATKTIKQNEEHKGEMQKYKQKLNNIRWQEEQKRVKFLSMLNEDNKIFIKKIQKKLYDIYAVNGDKNKNKLIKEQIQFCKNRKLLLSHLRFADHIELIDSDFYARIKVKYENLTIIEQEICSLLRFNFSSKEIAIKLNKSTETIKWHRKKIRKKLHLTSDDNLNEFCNKI